MGKKDKKGKKLDPAKEAAKDARKAAKAAKQQAKGDKKAAKGEAAEAGSVDEGNAGDEMVDIDTLLRQFAAMDEESDSVSLTTLMSPPCPRANCTMTYVGGAGGGEDCVVCFGGEVFDGADTVCNNDVFMYYPGAKIWKQSV